MPPVPRPLSLHPTALLLLPVSVLADGALCSAAACLVAIGAATERRHLAMLVCYGVAVGFDAHALLIAPFFVALLIQRHEHVALAAVAPVLAIAMLAVRAIGAPVPSELILPQDLTLAAGAPTVWSIAHILPGFGDLPLVGLALTTAVGAAAAFTAWLSVRPLAGRMLADAALLCALVVPELSPAIGPDAFLLASALALLLAFEQHEAPRWRIAALAVFGTGVAYLGPDVAPLGALAMLAATLLHGRVVLKPAANDNPLMARTA
jgi:hypothetical protein